MPSIDLGKVVGPQGEKGDQGIQGIQGPIGPVGPTGAVDENTPITFEEAETRANIESGEAFSIILGKIKKMFSDILLGAGSTLLGANLTADRVLVSNENGKVSASVITGTELGHLDGVTKNIQTQFNELTEKYKIVRTEYERTVKANSAETVLYNIPSGYKFYGISSFDLRNQSLIPNSISANNLVIKNPTDSEQTTLYYGQKGYIDIIVVKN